MLRCIKKDFKTILANLVHSGVQFLVRPLAWWSPTCWEFWKIHFQYIWWTLGWEKVDLKSRRAMLLLKGHGRWEGSMHGNQELIQRDILINFFSFHTVINKTLLASYLPQTQGLCIPHLLYIPEKRLLTFLTGITF